ncbi:Chromatin structure-remodeling complex subunit rsc9 [Sphaceloma murrayae]|uniref:Chromatin structure-remodeling complex subunit rsc9 n=1 Tax=Sphaceloma murrayae TaxID=2082308 RepID=A0A2K1QH00_9PEZI|nr:Chromatin structure-remodeling complex subunit rsc9 [Sphaceloma murrayae]
MPLKGVKPGRFDRESSIEHTPEYDEFIQKLEEYHEKRGTTFEAEPKVGSRHLNLLIIYKRILEEGGYDLVSDTKQRPLMWRKLAEEFIGKGPHIAAQAFQVKSAYYKNLAAFEISDHWKEDPPPREILEDLTAKGGNIRGRTLENFERRGHRESEKLATGDESDSGDESKSPKGDDDATGTYGRSTRGLRQAPPQRVLFQPDINSTRQSRSGTAHHASPSPGLNTLNGVPHPTLYSTNTTLANYEPRPQPPLTLKPVTTPANNPEYFSNKRKQLEDAAVPSFIKRFKGVLLPGTGFIGPNIYVRAQLALQSGLPDEERYALHHLVKISHERGDKYRFDQFPGLAEALIRKVLQVSGLFYNVDWSIDYTSPAGNAEDVLDGIAGTSNILSKLESNITYDLNDTVQSGTYFDELSRISEAALILRNMVMLDENAHYVAKLPLIKDYMTIILTLTHPSLIELQHNALETFEQVAVYSNVECKEPLYPALLNQLRSDDRGKIVITLRTTARLGMRFRENKRLEDVPGDILHNVCSWLALEDDEMRSACLDFLYQFSSVGDNAERLLRTVDTHTLIKQLTRLLLAGARESPYVPRHQKSPQPEDRSPTLVPRLAPGFIEQMLRYAEPERSSHWLRMCFEDDPSAEMTQIDLWKSYQGTFLKHNLTHPHLIAGDFIKNVSNTFSGASAQVAGQNKYVIRGIKPRSVPVDRRGKELIRCQWHGPKKPDEEQTSSIFAYAQTEECGLFYPNGPSLHQHILTHHLDIPVKGATQPTGETALPAPILNSLDLEKKNDLDPGRCAWSTCKHRIQPDVPKKYRWILFARHIETHVPDEQLAKGQKVLAKEKKADTESVHQWLNTSVDESLRDPCGVPLGAALCLRNIARGIGKLTEEGESMDELLRAVGGSVDLAGQTEEEEADETAEDEDGEDDPQVVLKKPDPNSKKAKLMRGVFGSVKEKLFFIMGHNYVLKDHVGDVLRMMARSGAC